MDGRVKAVNKLVKGHDKYLFAKRESNGAIHIYRRNPHNSADPIHTIFCLTDNWNATGKPREWGLTVIEARLQAMDLWRSGGNIIDEIDKQAAQAVEADERNFKNNVESFLKEFRRQFAKANDGINTSGLAKVDRRRELGA
jgi:hypothetical protein